MKTGTTTPHNRMHKTTPSKQWHQQNGTLLSSQRPHAHRSRPRGRSQGCFQLTVQHRRRATVYNARDLSLTLAGPSGPVHPALRLVEPPGRARRCECGLPGGTGHLAVSVPPCRADEENSMGIAGAGQIRVAAARFTLGEAPRRGTSCRGAGPRTARAAAARAPPRRRRRSL